MKELIKQIEEEIERHKLAENTEQTSWGRGFHNGSMTEAIVLKRMVRDYLKKHKE